LTKRGLRLDRYRAPTGHRRAFLTTCLPQILVLLRFWRRCKEALQGSRDQLSQWTVTQWTGAHARSARFAMAPTSLVAPTRLLLAAVSLAGIFERGHALHGLRGGRLASPSIITLDGPGLGLRRRPAHSFLSGGGGLALRGGGTSGSSREDAAGDATPEEMPSVGEWERAADLPQPVPQPADPSGAVGDMPPVERFQTADMHTAAFFAAAYAAASFGGGVWLGTPSRINSQPSGSNETPNP
jgi:hypothetical protein